MIMSEIFAQKEMDELLSCITLPDLPAVDTNAENTLKPCEFSKKTNSIDFRYLKKISERECVDLIRSFEEIKEKLEDFIFSNWGIIVHSYISEVTSAQAEEFFREVSCGGPVLAYNWLGGKGMWTMDKKLFYKGFLNSCSKERMNGLEKNIYCNQIYFPFIKFICNEISDAALKHEPKLENHRIIRRAHSFFNAPDYSGMGVAVSMVMKVGDEEGFVRLFWNGDIIENLRKSGFFKCHSSSNVFALPKLEPDTIVEAGRFRLEENFPIEPGMIFELNKSYGEPLNVLKNGRIIACGEGTIIDGHFGIRILGDEEQELSDVNDNFYNSKVIFGQCKTDETEEFWEGKILVLNEYEDEKAKIVAGNKVIATGEFCVLYESLCIKITQVLDK